ncbi:hypothetical protein [Arachnia propionica]
MHDVEVDVIDRRSRRLSVRARRRCRRDALSDPPSAEVGKRPFVASTISRVISCGRDRSHSPTISSETPSA